MEHITKNNTIRNTVFGVLVLLGLFLLGAAIVQFKTAGIIGEGIQPQDTITVSGTGMQLATPDVADISFSVTAEAATVAAAQATVTTNTNTVLAYLKAQNVADADVQTTGYDIEPRYTYSTTPVSSGPIICPAGISCSPITTNGNPTLAGYDVTDSITIKVRDLSNAGVILAGLGSRGVTNLSSLNFTLDNPDAAQSEAQAKAITDAKTKAQALASQLGVTLVRVVSFSNSGYYPGPIYVADSMSTGSGGMAAAPTPALPAGQDTITSNVSITYEIR